MHFFVVPSEYFMIYKPEDKDFSAIPNGREWP
jgi:hypothetical protein